MKNKKTNKFTRLGMRPYPLIFLDAYMDMLNSIGNEIEYKTDPLFLYNKDKDIVEIFYQPEKFKKMLSILKDKVVSNKGYFDNRVDNFNKTFEKIKPFFDKRNPKNKQELLELYNLFVKYFEGVCFTWVLPDQEGIPSDIKKESLNMREKTESYASLRDKMFVRILKDQYPNIENDVSFLRKEDIFSNLNNKELKEIAKKRKEGYIYYKKQIIKKEKIEEFLSNEDIELKRNGTFNQKNKTLKGSSAYKGKVIGIVRLIFNSNDLSKVKNKGDILVSPMTRPDFVPTMKKVLGIVTNEGGVICHAAIVARELKIPCIVGTGSATEILKDGDKVEVNADEGIVKIIERA